MTVRVRRAIRDIMKGLSIGYPLCCTVNYALDSLRGVPAGLRRGETQNANVGSYVPCIFHMRVKNQLTKQQSLELLNSGFAVTHLAPHDSVEIRVNGDIVSSLRIPKGTDGLLLSQVRLHPELLGPN